MNDAYDIFDSYLESNLMTDFFKVIIDVYKAAGLIQNEVEAEKN